MTPHRTAGILNRGVAILALMVALDLMTSTPAMAVNYLLEQPLRSGISGNLFVAHVTQAGLPAGTFDEVLWQKNPFTSSGLLVPTSWDAGSQTGFTPSSPALAQLGFQNNAGTSTAQIEGDTVGAYINSRDLPSSATKMMIAPHYTYPSGSTPVPFASSTATLKSSLYLQVPTAVGQNAYVLADFTFRGPNGVLISYGVGIFSNGRVYPVVGTGYDRPSNSYMLNTPLTVGQDFVTESAGSGTWTGVPWAGWRYFAWSISHAQFVSALRFLTTTYPGTVTSTDPTRYVLQEVHLNAEIQIERGSTSELGWSMRQWQVWVQ